MKLFATGTVIIGLAALAGCNSSPPGGNTTRSSATHAAGGTTTTTTTETGTGNKHETFTISAPTLATHLKQGETETVKVSVKRGSAFHEDVTLKFEAPKGLKVDPETLTVKASDK